MISRYELVLLTSSIPGSGQRGHRLASARDITLPHKLLIAQLLLHPFTSLWSRLPRLACGQ